MKKILCLDCDMEFTADTAEEAMTNMLPHYKEVHAEIMAAGTEETKKAWMETFHKNWEEAEEIQ